MGNPDIVKVKTNAQFNKFVCPFLGRRDIYQECGFPFFINKKIFFVAIIDGKPVGIAGIKVESNKTTLTNSFVEKQFRNQGIFNILFQERLKHCKGRIEGTATSASKNTYIRYGFNVKKETKKYTFFEKEQ